MTIGPTTTEAVAIATNNTKYNVTLVAPPVVYTRNYLKKLISK